jgi:putative phosphoesterase
MKPYRLTLLADIHGTLPALETVLDDLQQAPPDAIVVAGDFLGGPQPHETLARLRQVGCRFILGNGEKSELMMHRGQAPDIWWTRRQFDLARWIHQHLTEADVQFLETLPEYLILNPDECDAVRVVHGTPWDINKLLFPDKEPEALTRALEMIPESVLVFAHTYLPNIYFKGGKLALNPGSVANNLNGDTRISYATLTCTTGAWQPEIHFLRYDLSKTVDVFRQTGFLEATRPLGRGFLESILTGENTAFNFILYAFEKAREAGFENPQAVPDDIWLAAEASYPWKIAL